MKSVKVRLYEILEKAQPDDKVSRRVDYFLITLILLNVGVVIVETVPEIPSNLLLFFHLFDAFSVMIFTLEYFLRIWVAVSDERYQKPFSGRLRYMVTPMALIDLIAILPFYLPFLLPADLRVLRALRVMRIFRLFKFGRYAESIETFWGVWRRRREEIIVSTSFLSILIIVASSMMYFIEHNAQPKIFSSIPAAIWWGVVTLTTVGYGDIYPITPLGRFLGMIIALLGIGMFAVPTGILGSGFVEEFHKKQRDKTFLCPYCGNDISSIKKPLPLEKKQKRSRKKAH